MSSQSDPHKRSDVQRLLDSLEIDLAEKSLSDEARRSKLEQLKVHGRDPRGADPIFTTETIQLLCQYAFDDQPVEIRREAMRCLANTLLLSTKAQTKNPLVQTFIDAGYGTKCADLLKNQDDDDEFLACKVLFISTYDSSLDFGQLIQDHGLAKAIEDHLRRHAEQFKIAQPPNPITSLAVSENVKLIYNIAALHPPLTKFFNPCIAPMASILANVTVSQPPLEPPVSVLINALAQLDLESQDETNWLEAIFPRSNENAFVEKLVGILDQGIKSYLKSRYTVLVVPMVCLLCKLLDVAPDSAKNHMGALLLPTPGDRDLPIGQSESLSSRLLRLTIDPSIPDLGKALSEMFFKLSSSDPSKLVQNIGYGYAAGYLMSRNIPLPADATRGTAGEGSVPVNPITGQRLDRENVPDPGTDMTEEEKEREAERLFVLFERLRANGVVNVENPVVQGMKEGAGDRVQEVHDSDSE